MCGIVAQFAYGHGAPPAQRERIEAACSAMQARGPDGEGVWLSPDGRVGFGHRRLAILDPTPAGAQPMSLREGEVWITYNGEIYNFVELQQKLRDVGVTLNTNCDTEVLLHLYDRFGVEMLDQLRGMYAFVIWDNKRHRLFAARDPLGIKPLYVADDGRHVWLCSQVKPLLAAGVPQGQPSAAGQVGFFVWGYVPEPHTLFNGVKAVPAGSALTVERGGATRQWQHYDLAAAIGSGVDQACSEAHGFADALADSVAKHLVSDVPVGVFLSAGLDSSTLAYLAAHERENSLRTITLGFEEFAGTPDDESVLAEQVARAIGSDHQTHWISKDMFSEIVDDFVNAMDQPSIDGVNSYLVSWAARQSDTKVALSGLGGDELLGGYPSFRQIPRAKKWLSPFGRVPPLGRLARHLTSPLVSRVTTPKYASVLEYGGTYAGSYLLRRGLYMPWELEPILGVRTVTEGWDELSSLSRIGELAAKLPTDHAKIMALEMSCYMSNQLLRDADWAGMAHSVEIRVPFVDRNMISAVSRLNALGEPLKKDALVSIVKDRLPPKLFNRPKTGFSVPVTTWMRDIEGSRTLQPHHRGWAVYVASKFCDLQYT